MKKFIDNVASKLKAFFYVLKNSLYNPSYYKEILQTPVKFSIKYFIGLVLLVSMISTLVLSVRTIPQAIETTKAVTEEIGRVYPDDLVIGFNNNEWYINKEQPFSIKMPDNLLNQDVDVISEVFGKRPDNLITFDKEGTINKLEEYNTLILVNNANILVNVREEPMPTPINKLFPVENLNNVEVTKTEINAALENLKRVPYVFPLFLLVIDLFSLVQGATIQVLLIAVLCWVFSLLVNIEVKFNEALRVAIHTITPVFALQILMGIFGLYYQMVFVFLGIHLFYSIGVLLMINDRIRLKMVEKPENN